MDGVGRCVVSQIFLSVVSVFRGLVSVRYVEVKQIYILFLFLVNEVCFECF